MQGGPRIKHLDDLPWIEVSKIRLADGKVACIREKWIEMSPRFVCFYNEWDAGAMTPPHGHTGDHSIFVTEGEISDGTTTCRAGSHIMPEWGDTFGPWVAGPQGCKLYGFIAGDGRPFFQQEQWQRYLADRGAQELPVPLPPLPAWFGSGSVLPGPLQESDL
jgi:hypothetical protein